VHALSTPLLILTASAIAATYASSGSNAVLSIGLSHAILSAVALRLIQSVRSEGHRPTLNGGSVIHSTNGLLTQLESPDSSKHNLTMATIRDTSAAAAVGTAMAALVLEKLSFGGLAYWGLIGQAMGDRWVLGQAILSVVYGLSMVTVHIIMLSSLLIMVSLFLAFRTPPKILLGMPFCSTRLGYARNPLGHRCGVCCKQA